MSSIGVLSPLPPERSGVADYAAALLEALGRRVDVTAYAAGRPDPIPGVDVRRATPRALRGLRRHDVVVAQIGNSDLHAWILEAIRGRSVVVTLHDVVLHHLVAGMTIGRDDAEGYIDAMGEQAGRAGRLLGYAVATRMVPPLWETAPAAYPLTGIALRDASRVIVHSHHAAERVREVRPGLPVRVIPLLTPPVPEVAPARLEGDPFPVIGCFGFVIRAKRLPSVMGAVARLRRSHPRARLLVVGGSPPDLDPARMAAEAGLPDDALTVVGYAPRERYEALVRAADIGVSLRHPTMGESSAAVAHMLALGIPTVVSRGGWYDELPAEAVARVPTDEDEERVLCDTLERLADDEGLRARMAAEGRRYAAESMSPEAAAGAYLRACLAPLAEPALREDLLRSVARAVADVAPPAAREQTGLPAGVSRAARDLGIL